MSDEPLRVLIVAEHASEKFGGEAILPFHYFRMLRQRGVDAYLIVHARTRDELQMAFPEDLSRLRFVEDMPLQKVFFHLGEYFPRRIADITFGLLNQFLTQAAQRNLVKELVTANTVVHQPIPVSPRFPSLMFNVGAPVLCGPMNGNMEYPPAFRQAESSLQRMIVAVGKASSNLANQVLRGKREAAVLLVANRRTAEALPPRARGRVVELAENGVHLDRWQSASRLGAALAQTHPSFLFMGRLVEWKALDLAIEAAARVPGAKLRIIGDGAMRRAWTEHAKRFNVSDRVEFLGWRSQQQCAEALACSTALVLPSLFECGGAVVLEAMAAGRAVIATAWGGPVDYLDATCGYLIPPTSREAIVSSIAAAMVRLMESPALAHAMGQAGLARVSRHFTWEQKIETMLGLYASAASSANKSAAEITEEAVAPDRA